MPSITETLLFIFVLLLFAVIVLLMRRGRADTGNRFERTSRETPVLREAPPRTLTPDIPKSAARLLTPREREVARLAVIGMTNRQIASTLGLSIHTVNNHLKRIYVKLEISSRAELAWRMQFVDIDATASQTPDVDD